MSNLYIVATPIGNLEDITLRALRILREVDFIICEDTRVTAKLLARYDIKKELISYHHHSKLDKINYIIDRLEKGEIAALCSDAGTPGISDPGGILVREILKRTPSNSPLAGGEQKKSKEGYLTAYGGRIVEIIPIPGPCAFTALASISGIAMDKFIFMGFPPHKKGRKTFFEKMLVCDAPVMFYESCHRIVKALNDIKNVSLNKNSIQLIVGRELTKKFESVYRGDTEEIVVELENNKKNLKGEFVVILYKD